MMAVAAVMTFTSAAQLLKGPKATKPTTVDNKIEAIGTLFRLVRVNTDGSSRSSPSAYESLALVATYTMPVPAGDMTASIRITFASHPAPTANATVYQAP